MENIVYLIKVFNEKKEEVLVKAFDSFETSMRYIVENYTSEPLADVPISSRLIFYGTMGKIAEVYNIQNNGKYNDTSYIEIYKYFINTQSVMEY